MQVVRGVVDYAGITLAEADRTALPLSELGDLLREIRPSPTLAT